MTTCTLPRLERCMYRVYRPRRRGAWQNLQRPTLETGKTDTFFIIILIYIYIYTYIYVYILYDL